MIRHIDDFDGLDVGVVVGALEGTRLLGITLVGAKLEPLLGTVGKRLLGTTVGLALVGAKLETLIGALVGIFDGDLDGVILIGLLEVDILVGETVVEAEGI